MIKKFRLCKDKDFVNTLKGKYRTIDDCFSIIANKNNLEHSRYGISVSKKRGDAVVRVRIRRQVRAMLCELDEYKKPLDILIIVKDGFLKNEYFSNFQKLKNNLNKIFEKVNKNDRLSEDRK